MGRDFCDPTGHLPKEKVADAVRCLGENPLQSEILDLTKKIKGQALSFQQFEEVVKTCKNMSQIKHLICSEESGEGLTKESFDMLMEHIVVNDDGMVRIADIVHLLEQK